MTTAAADSSAGKAGASTDQTSADVYVYDTIGGWLGVSADDFVRDVAALDVDRIVLHLNSPGGVATEGVAIANVLRAHRAQVQVRVDGIAASAASVIAMAGDEVIMGVGAQMMIHDAWSLALGNADELAAEIRVLDSVSNSLAATYAAKAGGTAADWRTIMRAETWYTAEEAVTAGLADRVAAADEVGTAAGEQVTPGSTSGGFWDLWDSLRDPARFDLSAFTYSGRAAAPAPAMPGRSTPTAAAAGPPTERSTPVPFLDDVRTRLGVAADADEQTVLSALDEALDERAEPDDDPERPGPPALPEGTVAIDAETLAGLRAAAARGDAARAQQETESREALVEAAVRDGRIPPSRRAHWTAQLAADPGAAEALAGLAPGLIPVGAEIGSTRAGATNDPDADALYAQVFGDETKGA